MPQAFIPLGPRSLAFTKDVSDFCKGQESKIGDGRMKRTDLSQINQHIYLYAASILFKLVTLRVKAIIPKEHPLVQKYLWKFLICNDF